MVGEPAEHAGPFENGVEFRRSSGHIARQHHAPCVVEERGRRDLRGDAVGELDRGRTGDGRLRDPEQVVATRLGDDRDERVGDLFSGDP